MRETLLIICLLLTGCLANESSSGTGAGESPNQTGDTTAAGVIRRAGRTLIDHAASKLGDYEYVRERKVSVVDESSRELLARSHMTRFYGPAGDRRADVLSEHASETGDAEFWAVFEAAATVEDTVDWSRRLLEDDPVVLGDQGGAYYQYTTLSDTVIGGSDVARIETSVLPGADRSGIRWAQFYIAKEFDEIVGFELHYVQESLLFDENSRFRYMLRRTLDGEWIPSNVEISTFLNLPLSKGQRFSLSALYKPVEQESVNEHPSP